MFNAIAPFPSRALVPYTFGDQLIKYRLPRHMYAEKVLEASEQGVAFSEDAFRHGVDKPFEVWRMRAIITAYKAAESLEDSEIIEPQPTTMPKRIRLMIKAINLSEDITKVPTPVEHLLNDDSLFWEWEVPYTIVTSQGFDVTCDADVFPAYCINDASGDCSLTSITVGFARVEVSFQGYLIILQNPSEC